MRSLFGWKRFTLYLLIESFCSLTHFCHFNCYTLYNHKLILHLQFAIDHASILTLRFIEFKDALWSQRSHLQRVVQTQHQFPQLTNVANRSFWCKWLGHREPNESFGCDNEWIWEWQNYSSFQDRVSYQSPIFILISQFSHFFSNLETASHFDLLTSFALFWISLTGVVIDSSSPQLLSFIQAFIQQQQSSPITLSLTPEDLNDPLLSPPMDQAEQGRFTGILFVMNSYTFLLVLESTTVNLIEFIKSLQEQKNIKSSKILTFTEEALRDFPQFNHHTNVRQNLIKTEDEQSNLSEEECLQLVVQILRSLSEIGRELISLSEKQQQSRVQDYVATLQQASTTTQQSANKITLYNKIPTYELLRTVIELDSVHLFTIPEFLQVFDQPIDCVLESDLVHPQESRCTEFWVVKYCKVDSLTVTKRGTKAKKFIQQLICH